MLADLSTGHLSQTLDTNVLARYLVADDASQFALAQRLIRQCVQDGQTLFVPVTVTLELEWVLRARYRYGKDAVLETLSALLSSAELIFESEQALEVVLHLYRTGQADLADAMHTALAAQAGALPLLSLKPPLSAFSSTSAAQRPPSPSSAPG